MPHLMAMRAWAALHRMAREGSWSFSFRIGTDPVAKASKASTRRQPVRVSRMSSWMSSFSVFSFCTSDGTKPLSTIPMATARTKNNLPLPCLSSGLQEIRVKGGPSYSAVLTMGGKVQGIHHL